MEPHLNEWKIINRNESGRALTMNTEKRIILGIHVKDRVKNASEVQKLLTEHGCNIKTRIGLHEVTGKYCAGYGIILLEMIGADAETDTLFNKLNDMKGVNVQKMVFV
jgi:ACT domain-containing protein